MFLSQKRSFTLICFISCINFSDLLVIKHSHTRSKIIFSSLYKWPFVVLFVYFMAINASKTPLHLLFVTSSHIMLFFSFFFEARTMRKNKCGSHSCVKIVWFRSGKSHKYTYISIYIYIYLIMVMMMMHLKTNINTINENNRYAPVFDLSRLVHWMLIFTQLPLSLISNLLFFASYNEDKSQAFCQ